MTDAIPPIVAIAGPTAAGKTQLALDLCERFERGYRDWRGAEIVSVDSAQIYVGMDIGTAKPDAEILARIPHHLIDILDPATAYSAAQFAQDARAAIDSIRERGRIPLLVGGTMLYFRALFEGLSALPSADADARARIAARAQALGWPVLHAQLALLDPETALRLHPNDSQRIGRALEVIELTGAPLAQSYARRDALVPLGRTLRFVVSPDSRQVLHERIESRFNIMIEKGFIDEVRALRARGDLHLDLPSMRAVGYRQIWNYLAGEASLDQAILNAIAATRRYAKRQLTWLRSDPSWMPVNSPMGGPETERVLASIDATFHHHAVPESQRDPSAQ